MRINQLLFILIFTMFISVPVSAKEPIKIMECMVDRVVDGDTVSVVVRNGGGARIKIRLYGIDAPETEKVGKKSGKVSKAGQPFGEEASQALASKINNAIVVIKVYDIDRYKRLVGVIYKGDRDINREMVQEGWAWAYRQYLDRPHASEYIPAEEQAREKKLGLWKQSNPQPPWEFRKRQRMGKE